jgi:hypothetical protein
MLYSQIARESTKQFGSIKYIMQLLNRTKFQSQNVISTLEESLYLWATRGMMRAMLNANCVRNIHMSPQAFERTENCKPAPYCPIIEQEVWVLSTNNVRLINWMHQVMSRVQPLIFYSQNAFIGFKFYVRNG